MLPWKRIAIIVPLALLFGLGGGGLACHLLGETAAGIIVGGVWGIMCGAAGGILILVKEEVKDEDCRNNLGHHQ